MGKNRYVVALVVAFVVASAMLVMPSMIMAGPPGDATVEFGRPVDSVGSGCEPAFGCFDDQSWRASRKMTPGTVAISAGSEVTFNINFVHQVAIYEPGKMPRDIQPTAGFLVNDSDGRVAISPDINFGAPLLEDVFVHTFDEPGRYLVICNIAPHFEEARMWGWVVVR